MDVSEDPGTANGHKTPTGRKRQCPDSIDFPEHIRQFRLEAIFHPKFENESSTDRQIRKKMIDKVDAGEGYLEVSLKHSGSLLLWSGGQRYYSKNSTNNQFTLVGEMLLRQHFARIEYCEEGKENLYQICSDYVQAQRLTLAFEVVTAFLGDHGQRPQRDFLILTAVADKSSERFYSTSEVIAFSQKYYLPSNDCWVYTTRNSVLELLKVYDNSRETGLASTVLPLLTGVSECHIVSMYPHVDFQGDIIEGVVIRFVPYQGQDEEGLLQSMNVLSQRGKEILDKVPATVTDYPELPNHDASTQSPILVTNTRSLSQQSSMIKGDSTEHFTRSLQSVLESERQCNLHAVPKSENVDVAAIAARLVNSGDAETRRIAKLLKRLSDLNLRHSLGLYRETSSSGTRWICIVHVFHDDSFRKYRANMEPGDMNLFRGFSIVLMTEASCNVTEMNVFDENGANHNIGGREFLMLKMKFLPYMVRTFACRNHLRTLKQGGPSAFVKATNLLLSKWGVSRDACSVWQPFFRSWASYAEDWQTARPHDAPPTLPLLTETRYLDHLEHFKTLYESGNLVVNNSEIQSSFRGLAIIVSPDLSLSERVASMLSSQLGGARYLKDLQEISPNDLWTLCEPDRGAICPAVPHQVKAARKLAKSSGENLAVIFVQCQEHELTALERPDEESRMLAGFVKSFRKTRCAYTADVLDTTGCGDDWKNVRDKLLELGSTESVDRRPGLLVFFPSIPGCGKSSIVKGSIMDDLKNSVRAVEPSAPREVTLFEGDRVKGKFWAKVRAAQMKAGSSITIVDKNVPSTSWKTVADVCTAGKAIGVPIIPDPNTLTTTEIVGSRSPDGKVFDDRKHIYPFSLKYYAVCMGRVLARKAGSHVGGLDSGVPRCCMVVAKFMSFYRRIPSDHFFETIHENFARSGARIASEPIVLPFLEDGAPDLPQPLRSLLEESLKVQFGYDMAKIDTGKVQDVYLDDLENRLRECLGIHATFLCGLAVSEATTTDEFKTQLVRRVRQLGDLSATDISLLVPMESENVSYIKLAAIDISVDDIHTFLLSIDASVDITQFLDLIGGGSQLMGKEACGDFVQNTHVTLLHSSESSQGELHSKFASLVGEHTDITVTGLIWSDEIAALAVTLLPTTIEGGKSIPEPSNNFAHITIWSRPGVPAVRSNGLPSLAATGGATRIDLPDAAVLKGEISLWTNSQTSKPS